MSFGGIGRCWRVEREGKLNEMRDSDKNTRYRRKDKFYSNNHTLPRMIELISFFFFLFFFKFSFCLFAFDKLAVFSHYFYVSGSSDDTTDIFSLIIIIIIIIMGKTICTTFIYFSGKEKKKED